MIPPSACAPTGHRHFVWPGASTAGARCKKEAGPADHGAGEREGEGEEQGEGEGDGKGADGGALRLAPEGRCRRVWDEHDAGADAAARLHEPRLDRPSVWSGRRTSLQTQTRPVGGPSAGAGRRRWLWARETACAVARGEGRGGRHDDAIYLILRCGLGRRYCGGPLQRWRRD